MKNKSTAIESQGDTTAKNYRDKFSDLDSEKRQIFYAVIFGSVLGRAAYMEDKQSIELLARAFDDAQRFTNPLNF